jgi:4-amino-4-deoxy-L-arabinose transferase-like glycosyltransferase
MIESKTFRVCVVTIAVLGLAAAIFFRGQGHNPPGFFVDESSIAFNALTIARDGVDEFGTPYPLFFKAFGEYKNPVYIYLLAAVWKVAAPSNLMARRFSALLGFAAASILGWLGWRIARRHWIALATFLTALFMPNLFEVSRLVFEVALYPLVLALFLWAAYAAFARERWSTALVSVLAVSLAALTFTYTIGRLHAPLLLAALCIFAFRRERRLAIAALVILYAALAIVPLIVFNRTHDGALSRRPQQVSYVSELRDEPKALIETFAKHYIADIDPIESVTKGDPNARHHVPGSGGSVLAMSFVLAAIGAVEAIRRRDRWWLFVLASALLSVIPAALTKELHHSLRLIPFPILLIVLSIPALERMRERGAMRIAIAAALVIGLAQVGWFLFHYQRDGWNRDTDFNTGYGQVLADVEARHPPVIDLMGTTYIHGYWYGAQLGIDRSRFNTVWNERSKSVVITWWWTPCRGQVISRHGLFTACVRE